MKHTLTTLFLAATLCASALVMPQARAQYSDDIPDFTLANSWSPLNTGAFYPNAVIMNDIIRSGENGNAGSKSSQGVRKATPKKALTKTTYRESPAVHKQVLTRFNNWIATKLNASDAASIRRDFENDMMGRWAKEVAPDLKRGDVADALTAY